MIIDSHVHIFPLPGGPSDCGSANQHVRWLQLYMVHHGQPVRRVADGPQVDGPNLADLPFDGISKPNDVGLRVGTNGWFLWDSKDASEDTQFMPPSYQTNWTEPEYLLAEMGSCGRGHGCAQKRPPLEVRVPGAGRRGEGWPTGGRVYWSRGGPGPERAVSKLGEHARVRLRRRRPVLRNFLAIWDTVRDLRVPPFYQVTGPRGPSIDHY